MSEVVDILTKRDKVLANKLEELELERFSISSFNSFRTNRFTWYLRYVLGFQSQYPMESAWRGQAIEHALNLAMLSQNVPGIKDLIKIAIESYQGKLLEKLFKVYPKTVDGFDKDSISKMLRGLPKEQFPEKLKLIVDTHWKINSEESLPGYLIPDHPDYDKYLKKVESQYSLIEESIPEALSYFLPLKGFSGFKNQRRIKASPSHYGIAIPTIGYTDYEFDDFGLDLKTCDPKMLPKSWDKVKWNYKCQAAFYSSITGKPWKIVFASKLSSEAKKINLICSMALKGLSIDEIPNAFKSVNGSGTTKPTIEKILRENIKEGKFEPLSAIRVFDLPNEEIQQYEYLNKTTAEAIMRMVSACKKESFFEDMKYHCLGDIEQLFLKPDEIRKIEEVWGFSLPEPINEEEEKEVA
jgi:hypothetical protein